MLVGRSGLLIEPLLPNGGFSVTVRIPAFLFRMNIICQGLLVPTPERPVANGILALTDGHVIQVL
jgi:hypothetical protein